MTDQEFLSQNLDVLYQNLSFPSLTKNWIFLRNYWNLIVFLYLSSLYRLF